MPPYLLISYFHTHPITILLEILGERMHGPYPHLKCRGPSLQSPPKSPPMGLMLTDLNIGFAYTVRKRVKETLHRPKRGTYSKGLAVISHFDISGSCRVRIEIYVILY